MNTIKNLCIISCFFCVQLKLYSMELYEDKKIDGLTKQNILWKNIVDSEYKQLPKLSDEKWSSLIGSIKGILNLAKTFNNNNDYHVTAKKKLIHSYGTVFKGRYISSGNHSYTGLLSERNTPLILRFSLAGNPDSLKSYTPGLAIKFLVDNQYSKNIMVMNSLNGQKSNSNFFAMDFSNVIPRPESFILKTLEFIFSLVHKPATHLPLQHLCNINSKGHNIKKPNSPFMITLSAPENIKNLISKNTRVDFRKELEKIQKNSIIYNVYAKSDSNSKAILIGNIISESKAKSSYFGDKNLFFQHHH